VPGLAKLPDSTEGAASPGGWAADQGESLMLADKMIGRLERVDVEIDAGKAAVARRDAGDVAAHARRAADEKHRVVDICPSALRDVFDIFFYLDIAEDEAVRYPDNIPSPVDLDDVIENLTQSLDDIEYFLEEGDYHSIEPKPPQEENPQGEEDLKKIPPDAG
jgi:hypothetical protein